MKPLKIFISAKGEKMGKIKNYELLEYNKEKGVAIVRIPLNPEEKKYQFYLPRLITHSLVNDKSKKIILTINITVE